MWYSISTEFWPVSLVRADSAYSYAHTSCLSWVQFKGKAQSDSCLAAGVAIRNSSATAAGRRTAVGQRADRPGVTMAPRGPGSLPLQPQMDGLG